MYVDMSIKIRDLENKVLEEKVNGSLEPITVGKVLVGALLNSPDQHMISGADKEARFRLAVQLTASSNATISIDSRDIDLLKDVVGKSFGTLVVGRVYDILNRKPPE